MLQRRPDDTGARAEAVAVAIFLEVAQLVGGGHLELVVTQAGQQLPLVIDAQLILHVDATAFDFGVVVAGKGHGAPVALAAIRVVQVERGHGLACAVELRVTALAADFHTGQQAMLETERIDRAFGLQVVEQVAGAQILLPALPGHALSAGVEAGQVGVVEIAVEFEQAGGLP